MEWKDFAFAIGGFLGGLLTSLFKAVFPAYIELSTENRDLRKECKDLREQLLGMEDALRDEQESDAQEDRRT